MGATTEKGQGWQGDLEQYMGFRIHRGLPFKNGIVATTEFWNIQGDPLVFFKVHVSVVVVGYVVGCGGDNVVIMW